MRNLWVMALLLAGCAAPTPGSEDLAFGAVPEWAVGDSWTYESADEYRNERYTVEAIETVAGNKTYRMATRVRDGTDLFSGTAWVRASDLAVIRSQVRVLGADVRQDCGGIFPLENRSLVCTTEHQGRTTRVPTTITVAPPAPVVTPAGTFQAVELRSVDSRTNVTQSTTWYAPQVAWLVKFDHGDGVLLLKEIQATVSD